KPSAAPASKGKGKKPQPEKEEVEDDEEVEIEEGSEEEEEEKPKKKVVAPKSKSKASSSGTEMPAKEANGTCEAEGKKGTCQHSAFYTCDEECEECESKPFCSQHWKIAHGVPTRVTKEITDDNQCSQNTAKGPRCKKTAFGCNSDGEKACNFHGGPKKGESGVSGTKSTTASTGPLQGANVLKIMIVTHDQLITEPESDEENIVKLGEVSYHAERESFKWLLGLMRLFQTGTPEAKILTKQLAAAAVFHKDQEFKKHFKHPMMHYIREVVGAADCNWLIDLFRSYADSSTTAQGKAITKTWQWMSEDMELKDKPSTKKKSDVKVEAEQVSSGKRRAKTSSLIEKTKALLKKKAEEEAAAAAAKEEEEEVESDDKEDASDEEEEGDDEEEEEEEEDAEAEPEKEEEKADDGEAKPMDKEEVEVDELADLNKTEVFADPE
ncbi:MAG: hypothetical protein ACMG6E_06890, partial [Candidatus Roizmanbacteria bacterium]